MKCSPLDMYADPMYWIVLLVVSVVGFAIWYIAETTIKKRKSKNVI